MVNTNDILGHQQSSQYKTKHAKKHMLQAWQAEQNYRCSCKSAVQTVILVLKIHVYVACDSLGKDSQVEDWVNSFTSIHVYRRHALARILITC